MKFDLNGYLTPPDIITTDLATIERIFVEEMPFSATRRKYFDNFLIYNQELKRILATDLVQWIDGSFVTMKRNPQDIDLVTFIDYQLFEAKEKELEPLRKWRFDKNKGIDGYFVKTYPENHKQRQFYDFDKIEWTFQFHKIRQSKDSKGFLQLTF